MNIKKLSAANSPIVNIVFSGQAEYTEYLNAIKKSSGMIARAGNFSISADSLIAAYNTLKDTSVKDKTTGEVTVKLSGSQIADILPLFFCMSLYIDGRLMETSEMTIVLQRDLSNESPFGFFVKTAYADIENEKAVQIGTVDFAKTIQESQDFDSSIQKAYFALRNKYPEENIQLKSQNGHEFIQIMKSSDDGKLIAFIDESGTSIKQYGDKEYKKLTLGDCFLHNREIVNMSTVAENTIREPLQTITKKKDIQR